MDLGSYSSRDRIGGRTVKLLVVVGLLAITSVLVIASMSVGAYLHSRGSLTRENLQVKFGFEGGSNVGQPIRNSTDEQGELRSIDLQIGFEELTQLEAKRAEALDLNFLLSEDSDFVDATVVTGGVAIPVKIRHKGDNLDHLSAEKPSFRVEVDNGFSFLGMTRFSIQHPGTRDYVMEWAFLNHLREEGVVAPKSTFIDVRINGESRGIYSVEEHFNDNMLEFAERRAGVILKWDEDDLWQWRAESDWVSLDSDSGSSFFSLYDPDDPIHSNIQVFQAGKISRSESLSKQAEEGIALLRGWQQGKLKASDVFDVEALATYAALSDLWNVRHGHFWNNRRFYYNPVTSLLEPVAFDMGPWTGADSDPHTTLFSAELLGVRRDPEISAAYVRELQRVAQVEYLSEYESTHAVETADIAQLLRTEFSEAVVIQPWSRLRRSGEAIRNSVTPVLPIVSSYELSGATATIGASNVMNVPVEVVGVSTDGLNIIPAGDLLVDGSPVTEIANDGSAVRLAPNQDFDQLCDDRLRCALFLLDVPVTADAELHLVTRIIGSDVWSWTLVPLEPHGAENSRISQQHTIEYLVESFPFISADTSTKTLMVSGGEWRVDQDIFVPSGWGLSMTGGTTLLFAPGVVMTVNGSVSFLGDLDNRIVLRPQFDSWGGMLVDRADGLSQLRYVDILDTAGILRAGWQTTGGTTFYKSDVDIFSSTFSGSTAEDALNVINAAIVFDDVVFEQNSSDAFDGDFVTGHVVNSRFSHSLGDGLDVSGSDLLVESTSFDNIVDKAISVGEASRVSASQIDIEQVGIGIASKDSSVTVVETLDIRGASVTAVAAYQKKPTYGPGKLDLIGMTVSESASVSLIDEGSSLSIDGVLQERRPLDVEALYDAGILGN